MASFWKSNPRKYCEYCNCWFADNKVSIEFHEAGARHKENVAKKLKDSRRNYVKKQQEQAEVDDILLNARKAALASLSKDVINNPDLLKDSSLNAIAERQAWKQLLEEKKAEAAKEAAKSAAQQQQTEAAGNGQTKRWQDTMKRLEDAESTGVQRPQPQPQQQQQSIPSVWQILSRSQRMDAMRRWKWNVLLLQRSHTSFNMGQAEGLCSSNNWGRSGSNHYHFFGDNGDCNSTGHASSGCG
eukprot:m.135674 g.135674  ORF g.135674 m.135674 type:complete len:242 (-) comp15853_c3_seq2:558-1283(-)